MRRIALFTMIALWLATPALVLAQSENHVSVGAFAEYYRYDRFNTINFVGLGGRAAFYVNPRVSIEGELGYDFERNQTNVFDNGVFTTFATTRVRPFHGLFGPKFDFGGEHGNVFATGKVGFVNFGNNNESLAQSFGNVDAGATRFAVYPGVGVEGYWGHFGLRAEVGDEIYFAGGGQNNLKITFGPQVRFLMELVDRAASREAAFLFCGGALLFSPLHKW